MKVISAIATFLTLIFNNYSIKILTKSPVSNRWSSIILTDVAIFCTRNRPDPVGELERSPDTLAVLRGWGPRKGGNGKRDKGGYF